LRTLAARHFCSFNENIFATNVGDANLIMDRKEEAPQNSSVWILYLLGCVFNEISREIHEGKRKRRK